MTHDPWARARAELAGGLAAVGVTPGDVLMVHVCLDGLGRPADVPADEEEWAWLLATLREAVGPTGTLLVPTYTFSFCRQLPFDVQRTPTEGGPWSTTAGFLEYVRTRPGAVRSRDPIHSVAGLGPRAAELLEAVPPTCFGAGSVFDRLRRAGARVCLLGAGLGEATLQHHVEERVGVPFRYRKLFTGQLREAARTYKTGWLYNVRILADNAYPDASRLEALARAAGVCRAAPVGAGEVLAVDAADYAELAEERLRVDPWFTARGPAADPVALERARVGGRVHAVRLPADASMGAMIDALWRLPRDLVSAGYDAALDALASQVPMTIHRYASGSECWSWIVPERWTCHEAWLETLDGRRLFSYADHPLRVVSYSLPFEGVVTREELLAHLHVHPLLPDAVPFIFKYYERDWGLCCTRAERDALSEDRYRVVIRSEFSYDELAVGEVVVPGRSDETVVLCAHLCHPAMVNDDLSGVVVGIDVVRRLLARRDLHYTYRLLIVPETIGSVAWLSRHEHLVPRMKGGLFLEMLGLEHPHALQLSFDGRTEVDECFTLALERHDPAGWTGAFRTVIGNDERQFNAPGMRVPMLSLSRVLRPDDPRWPYPEYHSSADNPGATSLARLDASRDLVLAMLDTLERNVTVHHRYAGEIFCSRYGIHVDCYTNPEGNKALFDILYLIDGTRTVAGIARECGVSFDAVHDTVAELQRHGLVRVGYGGAPAAAAVEAGPLEERTPAPAGGGA